jgi:probable HAF family extracellular repeat protein
VVLATIIDLGSLPGYGSSSAVSLNDSDQIVGDVANSNAGTGFIYSGTSMGLLDPAAPYDEIVPSDINATGQVVGTEFGGPPGEEAFLWSGGAPIGLGALPGADGASYATGINDSRKVVGYSPEPTANDPYSTQAFVYSDGTMTGLGVPNSMGVAINNSDQIAGNWYPEDSGYRAFFYSKGSWKDLGALPGYYSSYARGMNNAGQVVGDSYIPQDGHQEAIVYSDGTLTDLGTLPGNTDSIAYGINDAGLIVGDSGYGQTMLDAPFLYSKSKGMTYLGDLLRADSGWLLTDARAINNRGQIVGTGEYGGKQLGYLLTLTPPTVTPQALRWVGAGSTGGVEYGYSVAGADYEITGFQPRKPPTLALYWAPSATFSAASDTLIPASKIDVQINAANYGPYTLSTDQLGTPPKGTEYLLEVADPDNVLGNFSDAKNTIAIPVVALKVTADEGPHFFITGSPSMPQIVAHAQITGITPDPTATTQFTWAVDVHYHAQDSNGRDTDYQYPTQTSTGGDLTLDFGDTIRGGDLTLTVTADVDGMTVMGQSENLTIAGPETSAGPVRQYVNSFATPGNFPKQATYEYHKVLRQIIWQESSFQQFVDGGPNWSHDGLQGAGLMQVTTRPTPDDDIWNWQDNVSHGIAIFDDKLNQAVSYAASTAKNLTAQLNAARKRLHLRSVTLAPLTPNQVVREAIQRYNSGSHHPDYRPATNADGSLNVTVTGKVGVVHWVEVGNGYVNKVLNRPG